jgi:hypothetical protein
MAFLAAKKSTKQTFIKGIYMKGTNQILNGEEKCVFLQY